jgi:soluble lytic murein transglycosylase-like protein
MMGKNGVRGLCFLTGLAAIFLANSPAAKAGGLTARAVVRADAASGRLVRKIVAPAGQARRDAGFWRRQARVDELVEQAAAQYGVDPLLVHAVIEVESSYNPFAVSPKGATGLMQLMEATARRLGVANRFAPQQNIDAGVRYLKYLQGLFPDERLALAAYNAGEGAVIRHNRIPPYEETRTYVERVRRRYEELKRQAQRLQPPAGPAYRPLEVALGPDGRLHLRTR